MQTIEAATAFKLNGYLSDVGTVKDSELEMLCTVCDRMLLQSRKKENDDSLHQIELGDDRRFLAHCHPNIPELNDFVLNGSSVLAASKILGDSFFLFNEQFVVKGAKTGASFAWHQDSAYVGFPHKPYISVWIALDDITQDNGCLYILPRDLEESNQIDPHEWDEENRELNGYSGDETGEAIICQAGTMIVFSSLTMHRSGPNLTNRLRRAYLVQYSPAIIRDLDSGQPKRFSTQILNS